MVRGIPIVLTVSPQETEEKVCEEYLAPGDYQAREEFVPPKEPLARETLEPDERKQSGCSHRDKAALR